MGGGRWASSGRLRDPSRRIPVLGISQLHNASRVLRASECQRACWGIVFNISGQLFHEKLNSALKSGAEVFRAGPLLNTAKLNPSFLFLRMLICHRVCAQMTLSSSSHP